MSIGHDAGCPIPTADPLTVYLSENPLVLAIILIVVGLICGLLGLKWFPYVAAIITCLAVMELATIISASMGWLNNMTGMIITLVFGLILGFICGGIVRRMIWVAVGVMGGISGFFFGLFLHGIIVAATSHEHSWVVIALTIFFAVLGCVLGFKWGREVVIISTSYMGSYLCMRGFSFMFGGYPDEREVWANIQEGNEIEVQQEFWYYIAGWVAFFIICIAA